jgi:hypothetical protein
VPNPYTDILKETPLLSLEDRYPHLAGMKPRVDHRGDPAYEHLRVRLEPVPPYGAPMRGNVDRTPRTQADADRTVAQAGNSKVASELDTLRATLSRQAEAIASQAEAIARQDEEIAQLKSAFAVLSGNSAGDCA